MKKGGVGGSSTKTGAVFEKEVDLLTFIENTEGYTLEKRKGKAGIFVLYEQEIVARSFKKHAFYKFLDENSVQWREILSKRLLPDDALLVIVRDTLFIVEIKFQSGQGSTDEKLQTCDFKRKQYNKLVHSLGLYVEYVYVLNEWFKDPKYKDTLDYVKSVGCHYKFNVPPLAWLGLPIGKSA